MTVVNIPKKRLKEFSKRILTEGEELQITLETKNETDMLKIKLAFS